jgi:SAM-dependent methyltransferase
MTGPNVTDAPRTPPQRFLHEGPDSYWSNPRTDLLELVERFTPATRRRRALDVGCANGVFAQSLFSLGFDEVWGVEPDAACAKLAAAVLTGVVEGPFPHADAADHGPYDLIVFGDSLEHIEDPWQALGTARALLGADGVLVLSVPNVAHHAVLLPAIRGRWEYAQAGLLDRRHLRFFTPRSLAAAVKDAGLAPVFERRTCPLPHGRAKRALAQAARLVAPHLVTAKVDLVCRADAPPAPRGWPLTYSYPA